MKHRRTSLRGRLSYQRVYLAVVQLAVGALCTAPAREIARVAGRGLASVTPHLSEMESQGLVEVFYRKGGGRRAVVLTGEPDTEEAIALLARDGYDYLLDFNEPRSIHTGEPSKSI